MDNIKWDTSPLHHSTGPSMDAALAEFAQARGPRGASSRNVFSDLPNPQRGSGRSAATGPFASKLLEQWCFGQAPSHDVWGGSHASRALSTWIEATSAQRASRSLQRQQPVIDSRVQRLCGWPGPHFSCCPWVHVPTPSWLRLEERVIPTETWSRGTLGAQPFQSLGLGLKLGGSAEFWHCLGFWQTTWPGLTW